MAAKRHHSKPNGMMTDSRTVGLYEGPESRRRQESMDAGMIREDHSAIANLPQHVVCREYPKAGHAMDPYLDDTISGVDSQIGKDDSMKSKNYRAWKL